jgi:hypothetical protein
MKLAASLIVAAALAAACVPSMQIESSTATPPAGSKGLELLDIIHFERSPHEGSVSVRVANTSGVPLLGAIDLRAEPGMWLGPAWQKQEFVHVPPGAERTVVADYRLAGISPEAMVRVRIGVPEEHAEGWIHVPTPIAVRRFGLGESAAASAFLNRFDRYETPNLEIFAVKGMFSPVELEELASVREAAVDELSRLLDVQPPPGARLVFYPDAASKTADTHHVGAGMTRGTTIVEIYSDSVRLDPYHELAHIMSGQIGWAPAWLNEGFAVFASEHLGADALGQLGSPGRTVDEATCGFHRAGELLPLMELLRLPDIGPQETRPNVAYAQAASFVGFLVQRFGFPALRDAYASMSPMAPAEANDEAFARAFGVTVQQANASWVERLNRFCY